MLIEQLKWEAKVVPFPGDYIRCVWRSAGLCVFPGYMFGRGFQERARDVHLFCVPNEVGCTHGVFLGATGDRNCVLVNGRQRSGRTVRDAALGAAAYEQGGPGLAPDPLLDHERVVPACYVA